MILRRTWVNERQRNQPRNGHSLERHNVRCSGPYTSPSLKSSRAVVTMTRKRRSTCSDMAPPPTAPPRRGPTAPHRSSTRWPIPWSQRPTRERIPAERSSRRTRTSCDDRSNRDSPRYPSFVWGSTQDGGNMSPDHKRHSEGSGIIGVVIDLILASAARSRDPARDTESRFSAPSDRGLHHKAPETYRHLSSKWW